MHLEAFGIASDGDGPPFIARVTIGTKKRREVMHEWAAKSVEDGEQQAQDWMEEFCARCLGRTPDDETLVEAKARLKRLPRYTAAPELPPIPSGGWPRNIDIFPATPPPLTTDIGNAGAWPAAGEPPAEVKVARMRVRQVVGAARASGIDVVGVRVWPDGSIAAFDTRSTFGAPAKDLSGERIQLGDLETGPSG